MIPVHIGIDPGKSGALAVVPQDKGTPQVFSCPKSMAEMSSLLKYILGKSLIVSAVIEKLWGGPHAGGARAFKLGENYGQWCMAFELLGIEYTLVAPATWQKYYKKPKGAPTKEFSVVRALKLFPDVSIKKGPRSKLDDHNKADALLLAQYAKEMYNG